jgi:hypothetical protein
MVRAQPFSGQYNENSCHHLHEFEEMCSCLSISGMTQETLRWTLFPFSLTEKARQWYTHAIESANRDWDELKDKFCFAFFPMSRIISLPRVIFDFEQREKESIGASWVRFSMLIHATPDLSLPDSILQRLFCLGINTHADLCLDMTARGRFTHKPMTEQVKFLENFIDRHTSSVIRIKPLQAKAMSSVEESSLVEFKPIASLGSIYEPSPGPRTPKERLIVPYRIR